MATQNLIQYLETSGYNALPAGGTLPVGKEAMNRRQIETFISGAAIAANDLVALDLTATGLGTQGITIVKADKNTDSTCIAIGFALESAAGAGEYIDVTIAGVHEKANVAGASDAGKRLAVSLTPGQAALYTNADTQVIIAYGMGPDTANVGPVFVVKQM